MARGVMENRSKRMQVSVPSAHRDAMLRAIKVCRMVIPKIRAIRVKKKTCEGGYFAQDFLGARGNYF